MLLSVCVCVREWKNNRNSGVEKGMKNQIEAWMNYK